MVKLTLLSAQFPNPKRKQNISTHLLEKKYQNWKLDFAGFLARDVIPSAKIKGRQKEFTYTLHFGFQKPQL